MFKTKAFYLLIVLFTLICNCKEPNISRDLEKEILNGLRPAVYLPDEEVTYYIGDRMKHWDVPAVSLTVIDNMELAFSVAFGVRKKGDTATVNSRTLFQAASVSKSVAAAGVMALAMNNELSIDSDINHLSEGWQLPYDIHEGPITIRQILSHSAGLNVGGFKGYSTEESLPSVYEIIEGISPANSPKVRIVEPPSTRFMYSGGGYQIMQKIMEDVTGKKFPRIMHDNIFQPLNMKNSYYAPLDSIRKANAAFGHTDMDHIPNHAPIHVESAAGGLWTTPTDLGMLLIELMKAYNNQASKIFDSLTLSSMMQPIYWDYGLGFKVLGEGKDFRFSHGGATMGWHCHFMAFPLRGQAIVIMTNGTNGWILWSEIVRSVADALNWPNERPRIVKPITLETSRIREYTGTYKMGELEIQIKSDSTSFRFEGGGLAWTLLPSKTDTLEILDMVGQIYFRRDENNKINGLHLWFEEPDWSPYRAWDFVKLNDY